MSTSLKRAPFILVNHSLKSGKFTDSCSYISARLGRVSLSNLASLQILGRYLQWCRRIFLNWSMSKVEKKTWNVSHSHFVFALAKAYHTNKSALKHRICSKPGKTPSLCGHRLRLICEVWFCPERSA